MQLVNRTPFQSTLFMDMDRHGAQVLVIAVKATYVLGEEAPALASRQRAFEFADVFAGVPGASSLLYESDANWGRSGTDVAFAGYAWPARPGDAEAQVALRVGPLRKQAHVFGDRRWTTVLGLSRLAGPERFERMPLVYERAFGGIDDSSPEDGEAEPRNPVGCGLRARCSRKPPGEFRPPNIEDPAHPIRGIEDRPPPVGFSFVAKGWQPRAAYAGTYDEAWQADRMPLLPTDFDPRFHRAGSQGLCAEGFLTGGEEVELHGLTPRRHERFALPRVALDARFGIDHESTPVAMNLDCVLVDGARSRLVLVWHGAHPVDGLVDDIEWVRTEAELH